MIQTSICGDSYGSVKAEVEAVLRNKPTLDFLGVVKEIASLREIELSGDVQRLLRDAPNIDRSIRTLRHE